MPNKAVLWLGGLAAIMALVEMRPAHKAVYVALIIALMVIENHALDKERADFARDEASKRKEENQQFSKIGGAITDNVQTLLKHSDEQFANNMDRSNRIVSGVGDAIKTETGGNSFAFVTFTPQQNQQFIITITSRGKYPLRDVQVTMMDDERRLQAMQEYNKHPDGNWITAIQSADRY